MNDFCSELLLKVIIVNEGLFLVTWNHETFCKQMSIIKEK